MVLGSLIVILLVATSALAHRTQELVADISAKSVSCNDQWILECFDSGKENCFSECSCQTSNSPSVNDLFEQNECYSTCGNECLKLDSLLERQACYDSCPWKCNKFWFNQWYAAGLNTVCDLSCGCKSNSLVAKAADGMSQALSNSEPQQAVETIIPDIKSKVKDVVQTHKPFEFSVIDSLVADSFLFDAETGYIDAELAINNEFNALLGYPIHAQQRNSCDTECWKTCMQIRATKEEVFSCINTCGCAYENPNVLLLETGGLNQKIGKEAISLTFLIGITIILIIMYGVGLYIYKHEFDEKLEEMHNEVENEEGYLKLD